MILENRRLESFILYSPINNVATSRQADWSLLGRHRQGKTKRGNKVNISVLSNRIALIENKIEETTDVRKWIEQN